MQHHIIVNYTQYKFHEIPYYLLSHGWGRIEQFIVIYAIKAKLLLMTEDILIKLHVHTHTIIVHIQY